MYKITSIQFMFYEWQNDKRVWPVAYPQTKEKHATAITHNDSTGSDKYLWSSEPKISSISMEFLCMNMYYIN